MPQPIVFGLKVCTGGHVTACRRGYRLPQLPVLAVRANISTGHTDQLLVDQIHHLEYTYTILPIRYAMRMVVHILTRKHVLGHADCWAFITATLSMWVLD